MTMLPALLLACATEAASPPAPLPPEAAPPAAHSAALDPQAELLRPGLLTDGFSPATGQGWAPCGEALCRSTPGEVRAIGAGRVGKVEEGALELEHEWVENHERRRGRSRYEGLTTTLPVGAELRRGQTLGRATRLQLRLPDSEESPADFISLRTTLPIPAEEPVLALISHDDYELRLYERGVERGRYAVSFGQAQGVKEQRGDNRSPKGMYFVVARSQGPFSGPVGEYYGGHWTKINYPNPWDARRGRERGWISPAQEQGIRRAWSRRQLTAQNTRLGGGIGLHGWAWEWPDEGLRHLSWGCVVLHLRDVGHIYASLPEGSMVILL
jgi:hypothetical protein